MLLLLAGAQSQIDSGIELLATDFSSSTGGWEQLMLVRDGRTLVYRCTRAILILGRVVLLLPDCVQHLKSCVSADSSPLAGRQQRPCSMFAKATAAEWLAAFRARTPVDQKARTTLLATLCLRPRGSRYNLSTGHRTATCWGHLRPCFA